MTNTSSTLPVITINETEIQPLEYENQRVVTFAMIDKVHGRKTGTAQRNFIANKERLIEKEDYYLIDFAQNNVFRCFGIQIPPRGLTVLTESGYLLLVKSFTDDLAWQVQRQLVRAYFKTKPEPVMLQAETLTPSEQHEITKAVKHKAGENHKAIPEIWGRIKNKFKVAKYSQLRRDQLQEVIDYIKSLEIRTAPNTPEIPQLSAHEYELEITVLKTRLADQRETIDFFRDTARDYRTLYSDLLKITLDIFASRMQR